MLKYSSRHLFFAQASEGFGFRLCSPSVELPWLLGETTTRSGTSAGTERAKSFLGGIPPCTIAHDVSSAASLHLPAGVASPLLVFRQATLLFPTSFTTQLKLGHVCSSSHSPRKEPDEIHPHRYSYQKNLKHRSIYYLSPWHQFVGMTMPALLRATLCTRRIVVDASSTPFCRSRWKPLEAA